MVKDTKTEEPVRRPSGRPSGFFSRFYVEPKERWYYYLILPTVLVLLVVNIYPLIYSVAVSLTTYKLTSFNPVKFVGLKNYIDLLSNSDFLHSMRNTLVYVVCSVSVELVLGVMIAVLLFKLERSGNTLLSFFLLPMMLTPVIVGIMWRFMYNYDLGMINAFLEKIGLDRLSFISNSKAVLFCLSAVDVWQWTPYVILLTFGSLQSLPRDVMEATEIDGASSWQRFRHVVLPYLSGTLTVCLLIRMIDAIKEYDKVYTMTQGGPGNASETASFYIYRQAYKFFNTSSAAAASIILLIITVFVSNIIVKRMRKNEYKN